MLHCRRRSTIAMPFYSLLVYEMGCYNNDKKLKEDHEIRFVLIYIAQLSIERKDRTFIFLHHGLRVSVIIVMNLFVCSSPNTSHCDKIDGSSEFHLSLPLLKMWGVYDVFDWEGENEPNSTPSIYEVSNLQVGM